jgi:HEPN domain-containing protein
MGFTSDSQRKAAMAKLREARAGSRNGKANPAKVPRGATTYRAMTPEDCWPKVAQEIRRGDTLFGIEDWPGACYHYQQAAEQACLGAGARGRHSIAGLLRTIEAPEPIRQAGGRLTKFYRGDRYVKEEEVETGRIIEPPRIEYSQHLAEAAREDMQIVVDWCRGAAKAAKK